MGSSASTNNQKEQKQEKQQKKQLKRGGADDKFEQKIHRTDKDFEIENNTVRLKDNHGAFIAFYAPWCGYCHQLAPSWNEYAKLMEGSSFHFLAVDCTDKDCQKVASALDIQGYPTIMFVDPKTQQVIPAVHKDGTPMDRSKEGINHFLKEKNVL